MLDRTAEPSQEQTSSIFLQPGCLRQGIAESNTSSPSRGIKKNMSNGAAVALGAAIPSWPFITVAIVGLVLSLSRRARFPRAARWAIVGFACLLLQFGMSLVKEYSVAVSTYEADPANYVHSLIWMTAVMYLLNLFSLIALAMAVFAERMPSQQITSG
jgi:hypothetical protein